MIIGWAETVTVETSSAGEQAFTDFKHSVSAFFEQALAS